MSQETCLNNLTSLCKRGNSSAEIISYIAEKRLRFLYQIREPQFFVCIKFICIKSEKGPKTMQKMYYVTRQEERLIRLIRSVRKSELHIFVKDNRLIRTEQIQKNIRLEESAEN